MGLIFFNQSTVKVTKLGKPFIRVSTKAGLITLNTAAQDRVKVKQGSFIEFAYDDKDKQLYLIESDETNGYELRKPKSKGENSLAFNNTSISRKLQAQYEIKDVSFQMLVGEPNFTLIEGKSLFPLIKI